MKDLKSTETIGTFCEDCREVMCKCKQYSNTEEPQTKGAEEYRRRWQKENPNIIHIPSEHELVLMQSYANQAVKKAEQRMKDALPHFLCVHCYEDKDAINEAKEEFLTHLKTNK